MAERNRQAALRKRTENAEASKLRQRRQQITPFQRFKRRYLRCGARGLRDMDVPISEEAVQACESIYRVLSPTPGTAPNSLRVHLPRVPPPAVTPKDISRIKAAFDTVDIECAG